MGGLVCGLFRPRGGFRSTKNGENHIVYSGTKPYLNEHPDLEPLPGLGQQVGTESSLAAVQGQFLVLELLELHPGGLATGTGLKPGKDRANLVLALLLHPAANACPEEDQGVAQPELLLVKLDNVHHSLGGSLVVLGLGNSSGSNDVVPSLELGIGQLVGEASCREINISDMFSLYGGLHLPRQMAIPASTPLHWYWCITNPGSTPPGILWVLGTTQRMKWGRVL